MALALTADLQDTWPPRVLLSVTDLTVGDSVELFRQVNGERTPVRAGADPAVTDTAFVRVDAEFPFAVAVTYVAVVNSSVTLTAGPTTYTLPNVLAIVSDAISGLAAEVRIIDAGERTRDAGASVFTVGRRNVVVSRGMGQYTATMELVTHTPEARDALANLLDNATEGIIQVRNPGGYEDIDAYLAVTSNSMGWITPTVSRSPRRAWTLQVVEVDGWAPLLEARGYTLQDIADAYDVPTTLQTWSFASTTESWVADSGTLARVATPSEDGDGALRWTPTGSTAVAYIGPGAGATMPGAGSFTMSARMRSSAGWSDVQGVIDWLDAGGNFLSATGGTVTVLPAGTWTTVTVTAESVTNAAFARLRIRIGGTPAAGNLFYVDDGLMVRDYFTLQDLSDDYSTLLDIAQADWS